MIVEDSKKEIDKLFVQLKSALNFENSKKIEDKIWDLWTTHPTKNNLTKLFEDISKFDAPKNQPVIAPSNQLDISCPS